MRKIVHGATAATLGMPDELLAIIFNFCDARTLAMVIPAVSKRWLGVCQTLRATIDLTWAVRHCKCAITDEEY